MSESVETAAFKSLFAVWAPVVDFNFNKFNKDAVQKGDEIIDIQKLLSLKAVESTPVDDGSGTLECTQHCNVVDIVVYWTVLHLGD